MLNANAGGKVMSPNLFFVILGNNNHTFQIMSLRAITAICAALMFLPSVASTSAVLLDTDKAKKPIETGIHVIAGGSSIIQNYRSTFPEIRNLDSNIGFSSGIGGRVTFGLREYLGLTTQANILFNNHNMDMAVVSGDGSESMSALFIDSRAFYFNVPVCMTLRLNVAHSVRWNIDLGVYYSYGFAGRQRQTIYYAEISQIGQMVSERIDIKTDYFNSTATFQNSFHRSDIGIHFGTSLNFGPHLCVGFQLQKGFKNISFTQSGIKNPRITNFTLHGMLGWRF